MQRSNILNDRKNVIGSVYANSRASALAYAQEHYVEAASTIQAPDDQTFSMDPESDDYSGGYRDERSWARFA